MEVLGTIWRAFLHDLVQMTRNFLTPSISLPLFTGAIWLASRRRHWKPLAISLIVFGLGGMFYGWAGLVRLSPLFIDALKSTSNWDWAWIPTIGLHLVELLIGFWLWRLKSR